MSEWENWDKRMNGTFSYYKFNLPVAIQKCNNICLLSGVVFFISQI